MNRQLTVQESRHLVFNAIVLWTTKYVGVAVTQLRAESHGIQGKDIARLSPLKHRNLNLLGRYRGVTQLLLDHLDGVAREQGEGGGEVAQVVQADRRQAGQLHQGGEASPSPRQPRATLSAKPPVRSGSPSSPPAASGCG